jgi:hypothetical protein
MQLAAARDLPDDRGRYQQLSALGDVHNGLPDNRDWFYG